LVVLVPVNWGFFRVIGRVEWAWIAAPVIAIIGAMAVIRLAQLDIGFARSHTEIAVLEAYGGHQRAHLTRYCALYTSLSTSYDLTFDNPSALAQPFAVDPRYQRPSYEPVSSVSFRNDSDVSLEGFKVQSNSTQMLHCEQIYDLGGALSIVGDEQRGFRLDNQSQLNLRDVGLFFQSDKGPQVAWIGTLAATSTVPVQFKSAENGFTFSQWTKSPTMSDSANPTEGNVGLGRLVELATRDLRTRAGEVRLIGWTDDELPGVEIYPRASQTVVRAFVLVHLRPGRLPVPRRDLNAKSDIASDDADTETDEDLLSLPEG
jgi:hypothetical protein